MTGKMRMIRNTIEERKESMATGKALDGNPHVRFDEGEVVSTTTQRRGSLLYNANSVIVAILALAAGTGLGAVAPIAPAGGEIVALVPEAQKKVMAPLTLAERLKVIEDDKKVRHDHSWQKSVPLVLKWTATEREGAPWKIEIGKAPDLSDARTWFAGEKECKAKDGECSYAVPMANLEVGEEYHWRVTGSARCAKPGCGGKCGCEERKKRVASAVASFRTEDVAPRWMEIEGGVHNIRDLGGRRTADGRRVKQGMAYRGQGLNNNSATGEKPGRNRLTVEDVKYLTGVLVIRTDLDLRGRRHIADMAESPLGSGVAYINHPTSCYAGIFGDNGKKAMAENFRVFCDRKNYPIYFHCIGGKDRTGSLAYVLNGVLGVSKHELETDWESTVYSGKIEPQIKAFLEKGNSQHDAGFAKYGKDGDSLMRRIELYLLDCGVTEAEISEFRSIMLDESR